MIDDVFVQIALVLDDHGTIVVVEAKRVYPAAVSFACRVFRGKKSNIEKVLEMSFEKRLKGLFYGDGLRREFRNRTML